MTVKIDTSYPKKTSFQTVIGVVAPEMPEHGDSVLLRGTPSLTGQWPDGQPFRSLITQTAFSIGRALDSNLVVPPSAPYVSGRHLEIQTLPTGYALVDLNSTNGTRLNQRPVRPLNAFRLEHGDLIQIGPIERGLLIRFDAGLGGLPKDDPTRIDIHNVRAN